MKITTKGLADSKRSVNDSYDDEKGGMEKEKGEKGKGERRGEGGKRRKEERKEKRQKQQERKKREGQLAFTNGSSTVRHTVGAQ